MALTILRAGLTTEVLTAGIAVQVANDQMGAFGGMIVNPFDPIDQGIHISESIYINLIGPATLTPFPGNVELLPGQQFIVPPNSNVWVNAATAGHKFTAFFASTYEIQFPPDIVPGQPGSGLPALAAEPGSAPFPPLNVTGLTTVIPSYLYQEYSDDDDLQGMVEAQNIKQQDYVDTFNALNLPIYPGPLVADKLLDWVGRGLYGMARPTIGSGYLNLFGPLNTYGCNWLVPMWETVGADISAKFGLNIIGLYGPASYYLADDDIYRRVLTWHFFKQDGNYFSTNWLKRRIWRFIWCPDGTSSDFAVDPATGKPHPPVGASWPGGIADADDAFIADTKQISVTLGVNRNVTIRFVLGNRTRTGGMMLNTNGPNGFEPARGKTPPWDIGTDPTAPGGAPHGPRGIYLNDIETTYQQLPALPFMTIFKQALDLGVLEVPYQFNFTCVIG